MSDCVEVGSDAGRKVCVCVLELHFIVQSVLRPSVHANLIRCFCSNLGAVCLCLCVCSLYSPERGEWVCDVQAADRWAPDGAE